MLTLTEVLSTFTPKQVRVGRGHLLWWDTQNRALPGPAGFYLWVQLTVGQNRERCSEAGLRQRTWRPRRRAPSVLWRTQTGREDTADRNQNQNQNRPF